MPAPTTIIEFIDLVAKSNVLEKRTLDGYLQKVVGEPEPPETPKVMAQTMVRDGILTNLQAGLLLKGKWRNFIISGKYKLLEHLGTGGMGSVYLCEHVLMRRRVALKVLPNDKVNDPVILERFYREARAVAALDHRNIVRAHDIDHDGELHFLVLEYVDGSSLQYLVEKFGPLSIPRAVNAIRQTADGLQHAHEAGLVHRDIKPGNLLIDRLGLVKVLDLGLARFFDDDSANITRQHNMQSVLGTADYLAPEQALDSSAVDIRGDIYSLGVTFYFMLTGRSPYRDGSVSQKLMWHQISPPTMIAVRARGSFSQSKRQCRLAGRSVTPKADLLNFCITGSRFVEQPPIAAGLSRGISWSGGNSAPSSHGSKASYSSAGVWNRWAGSFAIIVSIMAASFFGTSGRWSWIGVGGLIWCHISFCDTEPSRYGLRPVSMK